MFGGFLVDGNCGCWATFPAGAWGLLVLFGVNIHSFVEHLVGMFGADLLMFQNM